FRQNVIKISFSLAWTGQQRSLTGSFCRAFCLIWAQASCSDAAKPQPSFLVWKRVSGIRWRSTTKVHIFNFFGGISMHTSTGRVVAPVRRMIVTMAALFVMMACTIPAAFAQAQGQNTQPPPTQQQPGSITNPQPGTITQEHVANPPGNAPSH